MTAPHDAAGGRAIPDASTLGRDFYNRPRRFRDASALSVPTPRNPDCPFERISHA